MLLAGAGVGLAAAIAAQPFLGSVDEDLQLLVRAAFALPAVVFVAWWLLLGPGYGVGASELESEPEVDEMSMDARTELIEQSFTSTFGAGARPTASSVDQDTRSALSRSVRRRGVVSPEVRAEYGLSPSRRGDDVAQGG